MGHPLHSLSPSLFSLFLSSPLSSSRSFIKSRSPLRVLSVCPLNPVQLSLSLSAQAHGRLTRRRRLSSSGSISLLSHPPSCPSSTRRPSRASSSLSPSRFVFFTEICPDFAQNRCVSFHVDYVSLRCRSVRIRSSSSVSVHPPVLLHLSF